MLATRPVRLKHRAGNSEKAKQTSAFPSRDASTEAGRSGLGSEGSPVIVTCRKCDTSFQLDESRVPLQGIRVRCSRCKEAFFLEHASASASPAAKETGGQAAGSRDLPTPEATTQDRPASTPLAALRLVRVSEEINNEDENEWEFNHEPVSDSEPSLPAIEGFGADFAEDGSSGLALDETASEASSESEFGSVDDYCGLMEEEPAPAEDALDGMVSPELAVASGHADLGRYASQGAAEDLGEPESWDFFDDDALETGGLPGISGDGEALPGRVAAQEAPDAAAEVAEEPGWQQDFYEPESQPLGRVEELVRRLGRGCGWFVACGLAGLGLVSGLWSSAESLVSSSPVVEVGPLRVESIRGEWVDTARAGTLFVVSGQLRNAGSGTTRISERLQVALLADDGSHLARAPAPLSAELAPDELRELPAARLAEARKGAEVALARTALERGETLSVQAFFSEIPDDATRFVIESGFGEYQTDMPVESLPAPEPSAPAVTPPHVDQPSQPSQPSDSESLPPAELTWGE